MAHANQDGKWLRVNQRLCDITGYSRTELSSKTFRDISHPDDIEGDTALISDLYAGRIPAYVKEKRYIHKSGTPIWVSVSASMAPADGGTPCHICVIEDITRRRLAEAALRKSERSLKNAKRISQLGTWDWDLATNEFFWSDEIEQIFGMRPPDYDAFLLRVHPGDRAFVIHSIEQSHVKSRPYRPYSIDYRIVRPDESERIVHAQGEVAFDAHGKPVRMAGTVQDITERRLAEDRLRESEARFKGISGNIPGMVFQLSHIGDSVSFTYVSDGASALCGLSPEEIKLDPAVLIRFLLPEDRQAFYASMLRSAESYSIWNWEGRLHTADQYAKWVNLRATPRCLGADGVIWDGVIFDISESKKNEAEIRLSREKLRELSAHQMVVKEAEGKRIAREIHDELGQRLTVLRMDVMMLPKVLKGRSEALPEAIDQMKGAIDGVLRIVRDIAANLRPAALDMGILVAVEWLVDDFQTRVGLACKLHNRLEQDFSLDDDRATGIFRILQESLTNVARHANASKIEITLDIQDGQLRLDVNDNGAGFEPWQEGSKKSFGLSGMRERATALGGDVEILSSPGKGTRVRASIPL